MAGNNNWCVIRTGGCIGEENRYTHRYKGMRCCIQQTELLKEEAQLSARQYNKLVSPGSKKYFGIHYYAAPESKLTRVFSINSDGELV